MTYVGFFANSFYFTTYVGSDYWDVQLVTPIGTAGLNVPGFYESFIWVLLCPDTCKAFVLNIIECMNGPYNC